jgi:DNA-binding LacI/PurR family transcriptional regulator
MSPTPRIPPLRRPATLATVAEAVGVSRMTISNAYNRPDQLSPELRERILAAAHELGYSGPNPVARTLSRGQASAIGFVLDYPLTRAFTDPATMQLLQGVAGGCEERGLGLSLVPKIEGRDAALVQSALVDGFVVFCTREDDPRVVAVRERRLPYVLIDYAPGGEQRVVGIDDAGGARATAQHLVDLGHRAFALLLPYPLAATTAAEAEQVLDRHVGIARLAGWREALTAAGVDWAAVPVAAADDGARAAGARAAGRLFDRADRPTALIALSDLLALGALDAAAERGIAVPDQLSITGYDDIPEAALVSPALTTVRQPHERKGAEAIRLLLEPDSPSAVELPTELIVRASTGPSPGRSSR